MADSPAPIVRTVWDFPDFNPFANRPAQSSPHAEPTPAPVNEIVPEPADHHEES